MGIEWFILPCIDIVTPTRKQIKITEALAYDIQRIVVVVNQ
jgi:hypothetical protein